MKQIIHKNNQYLKSTTTIPINGISPITLKTEIIIDEEATEEDQIKMTAYNYFMSADWCLRFKPLIEGKVSSNNYAPATLQSSQVA